MLENIVNAVRHANKQARRLQELRDNGRVQDAKRLERELRHVTRAIVNDVLLAEFDEPRTDSRHDVR